MITLPPFLKNIYYGNWVWFHERRTVSTRDEINDDDSDDDIAVIANDYSLIWKLKLVMRKALENIAFVYYCNRVYPINLTFIYAD